MSILMSHMKAIKIGQDTFCGDNVCGSFDYILLNTLTLDLDKADEHIYVTCTHCMAPPKYLGIDINVVIVDS